MHAMSPAALARFLHLITAGCTPDVFNPWTDRDPRYDGTLNGPEARRERLCAHLSINARQILIGEASGYQGCHVSGIPFTSERAIMSAVVPRVSCAGQRLSTRHIPWSEPSATVVWGTLHALGIAATTILWNAFPWHPHRAGNLQSNRTPTRAERAQGLAALAALLQASPGARLFAVGRHAQLALQGLGYGSAVIGDGGCEVLRHPSMGGATQFREGLRRALRSAGQTQARPATPRTRATGAAGRPVARRAAPPTARGPRVRLRGRS